jgi:ABC-type nitrate/sulfonate/bicarbonate transport system ATPase subunit
VRQQTSITSKKDNKIETSDKKFSLAIDRLVVKRSEVTFVIGKTGCGKTALLNAIMNEMDNHFDSIEKQ